MIILGSTGSIGVNALNIAREFGIEIELLVAGRNIKRLNAQIEEFHPRCVVIADGKDSADVVHDNVLWGEEGILEALTDAKSDTVINALVGFLGLRPTIHALSLGKRVALANKESLVAAGKFIDCEGIFPVDSEHFGIHFLKKQLPFKKLTITASGGAFRGKTKEEIASLDIKDALKHPNWQMGRKITIDSATMTNKLFELLEARWLFDTTEVDAVIEESSTIHALMQFIDGSITAHFASADMRLPLAHAMLDDIHELQHGIAEEIDLLSLQELCFKKIEPASYPIWEIKDEALHDPDLGVVINAANEVAVAAYLEKKIGFFDISALTLDAAYRYKGARPESLDALFALDGEVRRFTSAAITESR